MLLVVLTVSLLATPVLVLGAFTFRTVEDDVASRSTHDRLRTAELASNLLENELDEAGNAVAQLSTEPGLKDAFRRGDIAALTARLAALRSVQSTFSSALAFDPSGGLIARDTTASGSARAGATPRSGVDQADVQASHQDFALVIAATGPLVSDVYRAPGLQTALVGITTAVRDEGKVLGLLRVTLSPDDLMSSLEPLGDVNGRQLFIVDRNGHIVASSDPTRAPLSDATVPSLDRALAGEHASSTVRDRGHDAIVTYAPIPGASWALYVVDDPTVVLAVEQRLERSLAGAAGATGLAALVAGAIVVALFVALSQRRDELARSRSELVAANADLETASRHRSQFLSSMSHELRTPMNAILGFSDLLEEQLAPSLSERQHRYFRNIREAGTHLLGLINDVLDISKVDSGRVEIRPEVITLQQLFEPVIASARREATERGIRFTAAIAGDASVRLDPARLRQVLYNLTSNALKFTAAGGDVVCRARADGVELKIAVADTGIGIPADRRERVFGLFERVNEDRSDATGTGLGLALSRRLVEMHGGAIDFDSVEDVGTTFRIRLPGVVVEQAAGSRLLVVEDGNRDAELIVELAHDAGLHSEVVSSLPAALAAIERERPLGVVLDLQLGDDRGERVLAALKAGPASTVPVIVVTFDADDGRLRGLGADDHLVKPVDRHRLGQWLRTVAKLAGKEDLDASAAG